METKEDFETAVLIKNVSYKKPILDYGYVFLASKNYAKMYRLQNSKTEVNFIVNNSKIAYELMKHFEEGKNENQDLKDIEVQLTMIPKGSSDSLYNTISDNPSKDSNNLNKQKGKMQKISASLKAAIQKEEDARNVPYFIRHTKDITDKAEQVGIIAMDSPYTNPEEKKKKRRKR